MKKRIITTAAFSACLALCAAVWPQKQPAEATPMVPTPAAVIATQPEVPEIAEVEEVIPPEEEKSEATLSELVEEADIVPKPSPTQTPPASEVPSHLNRMPLHSKNRSLPRHRTAYRTTWSMCRASAG